jgi:hypothetical protein
MKNGSNVIMFLCVALDKKCILIRKWSHVYKRDVSYPNETSKECIKNVLRSTLSYPNETSKECIQFLKILKTT